jgi:hypothetical protein
MLGENGYPETPDWLPESRATVVVSTHADPPAHEAQPLTWDGDDS